MVKMTKTLYDLLEVLPNAQPEVIKASYRALAQKYHPDKNPDKHAEELFKSTRNAYEILSDPHKRKNYDAFLASQAYSQSESEARARKESEARARESPAPRTREGVEARARKEAEARARKEAEDRRWEAEAPARKKKNFIDCLKNNYLIFMIYNFIFQPTFDRPSRLKENQARARREPENRAQGCLRRLKFFLLGFGLFIAILELIALLFKR
jgi:curved DNA-binding protein CbpA